MAGTRSSARKTANNSSSPQSAKGSAGTKRKSDDSSPVANTKSKRGRPSKKQQTLEETMPDTDEQMKEADNGQEQDQDGRAAKPAANGEGEVDHYQRPQGCWGWIEHAHYEVPDVKGQKRGEGASEIDIFGDGFKGKTKEGEDKSDPEKSLKDSRGGAGLNALDKVRASERDEGSTNKVE